LPRPGLLAGFDELPALTLICGPTGSGKTTLVASWARDARDDGREVLWLDGSVDGPDAIIDVLAGVAGLETPTGLSPAAALAALTPGLRLRDGRIVLVIDDFDPLAAELGTPLMALLLRCRAVHLMICVRSPHDFLWQPMVGAEHHLVTMDDLALTPAEVAAYAANIGAEVDDDSIATILEGTGGLAALVSVGLQAGSWSGDAVRGFVRHQVHRVLEPGDVAGVGALAHLDGVDVELVRAALRPGHERLLAAVQTIGAVQRRRDSDRMYLSLPPIVGEVLRSLHDPSHDAELAELHDAVITQLEGAGRIVGAVDLARRTGRHEALLGLVKRHWWDIAAEDVGVLASALRAIPEDLLATLSVLMRYLSELIPDWMTDEPLADIDSVPIDDEGLRSAAEGPDAVGHLDAIMIVLMAARVRGDRTRAREEVRRGMLMVTVMSRDTQHDLPPGIRRFFVQAGLVHLLDLDLVGAELTFRRGYGPDEHPSPDVSRRAAANKLAFVQALKGDHQSTQAWLDRAAAIDPPHGWLAPMIEAPRRLAVALLALDRLDRDEVERQLAELSATITADELWFMEIAVRSAASLLWGGIGSHAALHEIQLARADRAHLLGEGSLGRSQLLEWEVDLLISLGRGTEAQVVMGTLAPSLSHRTDTVRARLLALSGRSNEALAVLASVTQTAHGFSRVRAEALLLSAAVHRDLGQIEVARAYLRDASRHREFVSCFASVPRALLVESIEEVPALGPIIAELETRGVDVPYPDTLTVISLTEREQQLIELLPTSRSRESIARSLFVSTNTVKTQLRALYRKLGVGSREEAVARAYELGLLN
jgi:LuxR family maltose regulon positive regulatory protein